jgi:hypothetical protein
VNIKIPLLKTACTPSPVLDPQIGDRPRHVVHQSEFASFYSTSWTKARQQSSLSSKLIDQ